MNFIIFGIAVLFTSSGVHGNTVRFGSENAIIKPFGMWEHKQPPPRNTTIVLASPKVELSAQQVCGYTDWTTAAIQIPKDLLTANYWGETMQHARDQSIEQLLAISGALPSMLACNASPTFCHILNQAKAMAQGELSFTMNSCDMLDGLANSDRLQSEGLRACVLKHTNNGMKKRKAREYCITRGDIDPNKNTAIENVAKEVVGDIYNTAIFNKEACEQPKREQFNSSGYAYSVSRKSCHWLKELFPGVTVKAKATFLSAGTFQPVAEKKYTETIRKTNNYLVELLSIMHKVRYGLNPYQSDGPKPRHKVLAHEDVQSKIGLKSDGTLRGLCVRGSGSNCVVDVDLIPPIYRFSSDGTKPILLIDPASIYELVELIGPNTTAEAEFSKKPSHIELILTRLSQASSYIQTNDVLSTSLAKTLKACKGNPKLAGASAQKDCNLKISVLENEKKSLQTRRETDKDFLLAQMQFYQEIAKAKSAMMGSKVGGVVASGVDTPKAPAEIR